MKKMVYTNTISYCDKLCKTEDDYTPVKVKVHNAAMKKLLKLRKELASDKQMSLDVYKVLLDNKDIFIKQAAATDCLIYNHIYESKSKSILSDIKKNGSRITSMAAKRILLISEGKLNPNDPF